MYCSRGINLYGAQLNRHQFKPCIRWELNSNFQVAGVREVSTARIYMRVFTAVRSERDSSHRGDSSRVLEALSIVFKLQSLGIEISYGYRIHHQFEFRREDRRVQIPSNGISVVGTGEDRDFGDRSNGSVEG